jgi:hypothetical protein
VLGLFLEKFDGIKGSNDIILSFFGNWSVIVFYVFYFIESNGINQKTKMSISDQAIRRR